MKDRKIVVLGLGMMGQAIASGWIQAHHPKLPESPRFSSKRSSRRACR